MSADPWAGALAAACFGLSLAIVLVATQFGALFSMVRPSDYEVGSVAERDIVVTRDIIYTDENATLLKKQAAGKLVLPVFKINEEVARDELDSYDRLRAEMSALQQEGTALDTMFLKLQLQFPGRLSKDELAQLLKAADLQQLFDQGRQALQQVYAAGLIHLPDQDTELLSRGAIEVWRWQGGKLLKEEYFSNELLTRDRLQSWLGERFPEPGAQRQGLLYGLVEPFAAENGFLDMSQTEKYRQKAMEEVEPVQAKLAKDQVIVRKGDIISQEAAAQTKALGEYSATVNLSSIAGYTLFLLMVFALGLFLVRERVIGMSLKRPQLLFFAVMVLLHLLLAAVLARLYVPLKNFPFSIVLPSAAFAIMVTLILSVRAGLVFSVLSSLLILPVARMDVYPFLFAVLSGMAGTAVVANAERRIDLVKAGVYLTGVNVLILVFANLLGEKDGRWLLPAIGWGAANGFASGMLSLGFLPILEHMLNTASRFRLIELSDLNAPILKRLLSLAPGTYSHSISVANLAETACSEIGANSLLARVGAYYHDIGKIEQAEYFIENQRAFNKHDELKPSLSAAVIRSHLKMGIEKARELALPQEVQDIIAQHHGRAVITYFYQRALENSDTSNVPPEEYTYPGERPASKEAAVVMLADAMEAASRTIKKPTIARLEKFVWDIIMQKFNSRELSASDLTLRDLETIKKSFVQVLAGYYHSRIEYPKVKEAVR
jgi:putative nucleotidyltransferase with HDIG domain